MKEDKDEKIKLIRQDAYKKVGKLSRELVHARSEDKGQVLAEMEYEREIADMCDLCLD